MQMVWSGSRPLANEREHFHATSLVRECLVESVKLESDAVTAQASTLGASNPKQMLERGVAELSYGVMDAT